MHGVVGRFPRSIVSAALVSAIDAEHLERLGLYRKRGRDSSNNAAETLENPSVIDNRSF